MSARIPQADLSDIRDTIVEQFGLVPKPLETTWHHPAASQAAMEFGGKVASWDVVAEDLKSFAHIAVAGMIGCAWCLDYSYFHAMNEGLDMAKASQVPRWRETDVFTPLERDVLEYAEAMTSTPPTVTDALSARLLDQLVGASEGLEVTWIEVEPGYAMAGHTIGESGLRKRTGASIVGIARKQGVQVNPGPDDRIDAGDRLAVIGTVAQTQAAARLVAGGADATV